MFGFFENKKEDSEAYKRGQEEEKNLKEDMVTKIPIVPAQNEEIENKAEFIENIDTNTGQGLGTSAN